ncbi:MAG: DNA topoisomerase 3 [Bacteroides sp.]|nr:DNA topoisomerase 3 [Bacteroides sp.]MCM1447651.1 DNA topoisomerase 3 [Bacteroides sp.]MCM1516321.1 DNA topoisomerase 3 [Paraprevotella sp.]
MIVCIAEKPSVAKDIAKVLGADHSRDGYMEGNGYQVTWTFGHLCELKEPHEYNAQWKYWALGALPMIPPRFGIRLKQDKGVEHQFRVIASLMREADSIINCGDAGQEGELIQRWVMQLAGARCPVQRLWISSLTEEAIREGFRNLKDQSQYQSLYEAGLMRAIGDWTLGMNATRLYTLKYRTNDRSLSGSNQVLSIGRVQTPTLALIVRRQQEIENFVPTTYWVLTTMYRDTVFNVLMDDEDKAEDNSAKDSAKSKDKSPKGFKTREEGEAMLERIKDLPFTVTKIEKKKGKEAPPRLFDLTSLQVECNRKFGFSADQTLQLVQSLYEKKVSTYPRVDTTFLPDDVYPKCGQIMNGLKDYFHLMDRIKGQKLRKDKKFFDNSKVTDHHAIIPTGQPAMGLTEPERKVFDLIARRFIGIFYPDCLFETTTVTGMVDDIGFRATGKHITDPAWKVLWTTPAATADASSADKPAEEKLLPEFVKGESGPHIPDLAEKQTTPPKPYTEATLLRAMETAGRMVEDEELRDALKENGIGRPSTRAAIIETLFRRRYIRKERTSLWATPTGVELIGIIHEELLKSAELTGIWERKLRLIEQQQYDARQFLDELKQMVTDIVMQVMRDTSNRHVSITEATARKGKKDKDGK